MSGEREGLDPELPAAVADLGDAVRQALEAAVCTTATAAELRAAAVGVRAATAVLASAQRPPTELSPLDDMARNVKVFNPVVGAGNGMAVPLQWEVADGAVLARPRLGRVYEGPPTYLHGGIAALLMDQVLGQAAIVAGRWGMTIDLQLRYRRPVPLYTPLRLTGRVSAVDGRRTTAVGGITTEAAPDLPLVEASATFVAPSPEVAARYFDGVRAADGAATTGRLGAG
ncbi:PaaI family thioesterase [Geodermatophilus sp. CPCC 205761]|uniref:PaaI family thioesterase n=1 Tax=Geodermatophilus sp. CPCC 205761 TaxID=2936597 RepID=UPI003EEE710D